MVPKQKTRSFTLFSESGLNPAGPNDPHFDPKMRHIYKPNNVLRGRIAVDQPGIRDNDPFDVVRLPAMGELTKVVVALDVAFHLNDRFGTDVVVGGDFRGIRSKRRCQGKD